MLPWLIAAAAVVFLLSRGSAGPVTTPPPAPTEPATDRTEASAGRVVTTRRVAPSQVRVNPASERAPAPEPAPPPRPPPSPLEHGGASDKLVKR